MTGFGRQIRFSGQRPDAPLGERTNRPTNYPLPIAPLRVALKTLYGNLIGVPGYPECKPVDRCRRRRERPSL
jgi:hypothetical protein